MKLPDAPQSYWTASLAPDEPQPALQTDTKADVVIVGAGFTGLMTAIELKRAEPALDVVVCEYGMAGHGASSRNGSFGMTVVGLGLSLMAKLRGKQFMRDAHKYMERAVDTLSDFIDREHIDCDVRRPGFLRVATTQAQLHRLDKDYKLLESMGFSGFEQLDAEAVRGRVNSERYLGGLLEQRLVLVQPAKLVREEKRLALRAGVRLYENTPVLGVEPGTRFRLRTPRAVLEADRLVFATNAYSHLFGQIKSLQTPAFTYMMATAPLTDAQLETIGWQKGEGIEDARNLIHYYRMTDNRRLVIGGGPVGLSYGNDMWADSNDKAWRHLAEHVEWLFPSLAPVRITHRWGGPFSVTTELTPAIGRIGDGRAFYSLGCVGHGVSASHLNAQVLRDMVLQRQSDLLDSPFVNRRVIPWPPEPIRSAMTRTMRSLLSAEDWLREHQLKTLPLAARSPVGG